jgi:predicted N-formylglutamate amidohydrolase|tara:strand:- start:12008 stop:12832 length:825 start_codon:yes stop_codon:yes gene_type:complete
MSVCDQHLWDLYLAGDSKSTRGLLSEKDPFPVKLLNYAGAGLFVFGCEHAGNRIPSALEKLGLSEAERTRHIAWDIGAAQLTEKLSEKLDSPAVLQRYSRLVYDCNRTASHPGAFVVEADGTHVSANADLNAADRQARERAIYRPFHQTLSQLTDQRRLAGRNTAFVAVHSFNDMVRGQSRPWHVGFLYNQQPQMSRFLIDWFRRNTDFNVGDNQPYSPLDGVDHTLRVQAEARSIPYTMVEIRNDLLRTKEAVERWVALLAQALCAYENANEL